MICLAVLLKANGMSAAIVGKRVEMEQHTVNKWLGQHKTECIKGLETRPRRGRKPIMDCSNEMSARLAIEQDHQKVIKAREAWQQATGKEASDSILAALVQAERQMDTYTGLRIYLHSLLRHQKGFAFCWNISAY